MLQQQQSQSLTKQSIMNKNFVLKQEVKNLTNKNKQLEIYNQQLVMEITQSKENQRKLKQLNNMLTDNLMEKDQPNVHQSIKLTLQGQFMSKRIIQLQEELQKYQNGVHQSVERRVKKIVGQFTQQQELQYSKRASRLLTARKSQKSQTHNHSHNISHNHYKIQYNSKNQSPSQSRTNRNNNENHVSNSVQSQSSLVQKYQINIHEQTKNICPQCQTLSRQIDQNYHQITQLDQQLQSVQNKLRKMQSIIVQKNTLIQNLKKDNESMRMELSSKKSLNSNSNLNNQSSKFRQQQFQRYLLQTAQQYQQKLENLQNNWKIRYDNLLEQYQLLLDQLNSYGSKRSNVEQYKVEQSPINWFKKKQAYQSKGCNNKGSDQDNINNNRGQMLKDISNLVNGLGSARKQKQYFNSNCSRITTKTTENNNKIGSSSRMSTTTDTAMFTIKEGVNRANKNTFY